MDSPPLVQWAAPILSIHLVVLFSTTLLTLGYFSVKSPLDTFPAVGHSSLITSYVTALRWTRHGDEILQEGYDKYAGRPFKVATMSKWIVILSGKQLLEDMKKAPDEVVSLRQAVAETMHVEYTLGRKPDDGCYHIDTVRSPLTRHMINKFDDIRDEIVQSFKEYIPPAKDWVTVPAFETLMHIICRTSNRYFVGLPLCRDPGYRVLNERFTHDVAISARIINSFPDFMKPLVGKYLTTASKTIQQAGKFLGPLIRERLEQEERFGSNWPDRPNDLVSWLLDTCTESKHRSIDDLTMRVLTVNFAAIHTTSMAATQALFDLAIHPEYVMELRQEVKQALAELGWTKAALQRMHKVDSFLKESQRLNNMGGMLMTRKTLREWRLSDGTIIPAGTFVGVASGAMNKDERSFPEPHAFKGFRFVNETVRSDVASRGMATLDPEYVVFGYGRHACPGRFFAINEIKAILAHVLLNYDIQLENGSTVRPPNVVLETTLLPNPNARMMFRRTTSV